MSSRLSGKTVMVTGADGFIGSHLVERLVREGAKVRAFCLYNSNGSWGWLDNASAEVKQALDVRLGDIRDARFVERACEGVDTVFHLAALIAIPYSYVATESFLDTNVKGTLNVLEGVRRAGASRLIHTSTSEVYGTPDELPIRETHPLKAQSPYAASKVAADQLVLSYVRSFDVPGVVLRPFNTFGPRQSSRAVIPTLLHQLLLGKKEISLGRTDTRRDFTFVGDTVDGFVRAATADDVNGKTIQLGTGVTVSIADVLAHAARALNAGEIKVKVAAERLRPDPSEVLVLQSDPAYAKATIGWTAETSLEDGLAQTAKWISENLGFFRDSFHV